MIAIHKYTLEIDNVAAANMPRGARILSVGNQRESLCVWALVDTDKPKTGRGFRVVGTGHPIENAERFAFLGTVQFRDGALVFHVFDMGEIDQ